MILIGNKLDKDYERNVSQEEGEDIAKNNNIDFFEISNKNNINVKEAAFSIIKKIVENREKGNESINPDYYSSKLFNYVNEKNKTKKCC